MSDQKPNRIIQITATTTTSTSDGRDYSNVYGLDDGNRVWRWNPVEDKWDPHVITPRAAGGRF